MGQYAEMAKPRSRKKSGKNLLPATSFRFQPKLAEALEAAAAARRQTKTAIVEIALERLLTDWGYYPEVRPDAKV